MMSSLFGSTKVSQTPQKEVVTKPLLDAILQKSVPNALEAIKSGADVNYVFTDPNSDYYNNNVLFFAIRNDSSTDMLKTLIDNGADLNFRLKDRKTTLNNANALHAAAAHNNLDAVKLLLSLGLDINSKTSFNVTPLNYAITRPVVSLDLVRYLLKNGADITIKDINGRNALEVAREVNPKSAVITLLDTFSKTGVVPDGGRRRKSYRRKDKKSKKTRKH